MKSIPLNICLALLAVAVSLTAWPHDGHHPDAPNPSPNATASQEVGYVKVTVDYGRPGVKGREGEVWGKLVAYNEGKPRPWLAGANGNAVITFEENVKINGHALEAGSYGLMMIPAEKSWTVIFSKNNKKLGILKYTPDEDALRVEATPEKAGFQEWLTYEFEKTGDVTATLSLNWENLKVGFDIEGIDHRTEKHD